VYVHHTGPLPKTSSIADATGEGGRHASCDAEIVVLSRQLVFENTVFSVYADHVADKNGNEVPRYLSVVPKCLLADSVAGVVVLPVCDDKMGLIRIFRHPLGTWSWEAIKGHVEPGENVKEAAARELLEESGFVVALDKLVDLGVIAPEPGVIQGRSRLFVATLTEKAEKVVAPELGLGELVFYSQTEIENLLEQGGIVDASTIVLIYKWRTSRISFASD